MGLVVVIDKVDGASLVLVNSAGGSDGPLDERSRLLDVRDEGSNSPVEADETGFEMLDVVGAGVAGRGGER